MTDIGADLMEKKLFRAEHTHYLYFLAYEGQQQVDGERYMIDSTRLEEGDKTTITRVMCYENDFQGELEGGWKKTHRVCGDDASGPGTIVRLGEAIDLYGHANTYEGYVTELPRYPGDVVHAVSLRTFSEDYVTVFCGDFDMSDIPKEDRRFVQPGAYFDLMYRRRDSFWPKYVFRNSAPIPEEDQEKALDRSREIFEAVLERMKDEEAEREERSQ